jgi:REP element-mobilizing transposase RayT
MKTKACQQEFGFVNRGGKRRGAGRKPKGERAGVSHAKRTELRERFPVLVTLRLRKGLPSLRYHAEHRVVRGTLADSARETFHVVEYSTQSNHVHMLIEAKDERALSRGMNSLAVRLVRRLKKLWASVGARVEGRVLADRYHARILRTPREVRNALVYLLQNGRKHDAWRLARPDPYSSASSFAGWRGDLHDAERRARERRDAESEAELAPWAARARTWLLSRGWRRHGLIDFEEAPAVAA